MSSSSPSVAITKA